MMMFGMGIVFSVVALMVFVYLSGVSNEESDFWVGAILFFVVLALGYALKTLF